MSVMEAATAPQDHPFRSVLSSLSAQQERPAAWPEHRLGEPTVVPLPPRTPVDTPDW